MATYTELFEYRSTDEYQTLTNKIAVAVAIKAQAIADLASPTAEQIAWAVSALNSPQGQAATVVHYVIAANNSLSIAQINAATDSAIQVNVDAAVDDLFGV